MAEAQKAFLVWPKLAEDASPKALKRRKPSVLALKLNLKFLKPFVGWSDLYAKIGHVDFLTQSLLFLNEAWDVAQLKKALHPI